MVWLYLLIFCWCRFFDKECGGGHGSGKRRIAFQFESGSETCHGRISDAKIHSWRKQFRQFIMRFVLKKNNWWLCFIFFFLNFSGSWKMFDPWCEKKSFWNFCKHFQFCFDSQNWKLFAGCCGFGENRHWISKKRIERQVYPKEFWMKNKSMTLFFINFFFNFRNLIFYSEFVPRMVSYSCL